MLKTFEYRIFITLLMLCFFAKVYIANAQDTKELNVIPKPLKVEFLSGEYAFNKDSKITYFDKTNSPLIVKLAPLGDEGYILSIKPTGVSIHSNTEAGKLYGQQTFNQMLPVSTYKEVNLPCVEISDSPRFGWRGMHLDVSRHFFDKAFIKKFLDLLVVLKMNTFHWHLTDDQGWRIEIKKYPKLTEIGAWRDDDTNKPWNYAQHTHTAGQSKYGGFYTQEDIKEIVKYATERNITIVPEIDLPGHSAVAIYAYNWLSCENKIWAPDPKSPFEFSEPLCICNDKVVDFTKDILSEVIDLFPSKYIHIGGDECKHEAWSKYSLCKQIMEKEGLKTTAELQARYNRQLESFIISKGRKMIGWDEILEGGIAPEAAVMSWRGIKGGVEAAKHQHNFVMASSSHLYFDMPQSEADAKSDWLRKLTLEKVYSFDPVPAELTPEEVKYMLGVEACLWTEYMQTTEKVESQALPRALALSEIGWSPKGTNDYVNFKKRIEKFIPILDSKGYNYYVPEPSGLTEKQLFLDKTEINLSLDYPYGKIRYTTNGSEPTITSTEYTGAIVIDKATTIKAKTFLSNGKSSRTVSGEYTKGTLQQSAKFVKAPEKGLTYKYYESKANSVKFMDAAKSKSTGTISQFVFPKEAIADGWGIDYIGFINVPADGLYTFYTSSDDGSELYINGNKIVDNDGVHGSTEKNGMVALKAGYHSIRVRYFEGNYGESLNVSWEGPGIQKGIIGSENLFH